MKQGYFFSMIVIAIFLGACSSSPTVQEQSSEGEKKAMEQKQSQPQADVWAWEYDGARGPDNWANLNPKYGMCGTGQMQSPINLVWHKPTPASPLKISYNEGNATLTHTGYTYRLELTPQSQISYNGQDYLLEKIEFRTPSEHKLSGNHMPIELQFYHRSTNGLKQAILSLFVIAGRSSSWFDQIWQLAVSLPSLKSSPSFRLDPSRLIPPRQTFYHYEGSLTHPPCLEAVQWFVMNTPLQLSKDQINQFRMIFNKNNRPVQPTNGRKITNY